MSILPFHLLLACTDPAPSNNPAADADVDTDTDSDADTDADTDTDTDTDTGVYVFNGTVPDSRIPAPEFEARNMDGSTRSRPDLIGHPTVVWFYPAAASSG